MTLLQKLEITLAVAISAEAALVYHQAGAGGALVWLGMVQIAYLGGWALLRFFLG